MNERRSSEPEEFDPNVDPRLDRLRDAVTEDISDADPPGLSAKELIQRAEQESQGEE